VEVLFLQKSPELLGKNYGQKGKNDGVFFSQTHLVTLTGLDDLRRGHIFLSAIAFDAIGNAPFSWQTVFFFGSIRLSRFLAG
jgi:hypothetical protein